MIIRIIPAAGVAWLLIKDCVGVLFYGLLAGGLGAEVVGVG